MKKPLLIEKIARSANVDETEAKRAINIILSGIVEGLRQNGQVNLGDFGAFKLFLSNNSDPSSNHLDPQQKNKNPLRFLPSTKLRAVINKPEQS